MSKLDDLPSLGSGAPGMGGNRSGFNAASFDDEPVGVGVGGDIDESEGGGFDDFNLEADQFGDSSNKYDNAEKHLQDFYKEENEGFKIENPQGKKQKGPGGFRVSIEGLNNKRNVAEEDLDEESIEEDIQTDREEQI